MTTKRLTFALIAAALVAAVVAVASAPVAVGADGWFGFAVVGAVLALAAVDYRGGLRRVPGRR
ncbi:hypothetical protein DB347_01110 [Opitutaceae bacterium EW11]|nr:hypothetical protein DB347_01110 [Opitutaceae bacterium EW11]